MKTHKITTIIAILLLTVIIIIASFFGIYQKEDYRIINVVPNYLLGMEFNDTRVINLAVDTSVKSTDIYDAEGNLITEKQEGIEYTEENGYKIVENKANSEENLNKKNYDKSKLILETRLKALANQYLIRSDENGNIGVEIPENDSTDKITSALAQKGIFTINDEETKEMLLNNDNIKFATVVYRQNVGETTVYLQIQFDKEGSKKLNDISKTYIETIAQEENEEGELEDVTKQKNVSILLDGETYGTTYFGEEIKDGVLNLATGTGSTQEELQEYMYNAGLLADILNIGTLPIEYNVTGQTKEASVDINCLKISVYIVVGIFVVLAIYLIIKFKFKGLIGVIMQVGYIALLLLILRYVDVTLTISGIVGIIISAIINYVFVYIIINNMQIKKFAIKCIPIYIIAVILSFATSLNMASIGMTLLWGTIIMYIYNLICTQTIIKQINK